MNKSGKVRAWTAAIVAVAAGLFMGCQTLEEMAPPVGSRFHSVAERHDVELATLEAGRVIYISDCARCHSVEPISRYSAEHWREIMPRMARKTRLDDRQEAAVEAYILLTLELLKERERGEGKLADAAEPRTDGQ